MLFEDDLANAVADTSIHKEWNIFLQKRL